MTDIVANLMKSIYALAATTPTEKLQMLRQFIRLFDGIHHFPLPDVSAKDYFQYYLAWHETDTELQDHIAFTPGLFISTYINDTVPPEVWGPPLWALIHEIPNNQLKQLLVLLVDLLPCPVCAADLETYVRAHPDTTALNLHNHVNAKLQKNLFLF